MVKNLSTVQENRVITLGREDLLEKEVYPLQYSCLENSMVIGAWWATVPVVAKSPTQPNN